MEPTNSRPQSNPQTIAWLVLIVSFVAFCVACAAGTFGAYWFFFDSPTPINAHLTLSRGSITIILPDGTSSVMNDPDDNPRSIPVNAILRTTDSVSQGYLTFEDGYSKQVIATVFVLPNSNLKLLEASRPRFEWSKRGYTVLFSDVSGHLVVDTPPTGTRPTVVRMQTAIGAVHLSDNGSYTIDALDQSVRLYTASGRGLVASLDGTGRQVDPGFQATLERDKPDAAVEPYPFENFIIQDIRSEENPPQTTNSLGSEALDPLKMPPNWACFNQAVDQNETDPTWQRTHLDNGIVLRLSRGGPNSRLASHAESSCEFHFIKNLFGRDVTPYKSVSIRLRMKIMYQDVTTCGFQGSECPVMLEMEYVPADSQDGKTEFWRQGFYSIRPPEDTSVRTCDTCPHDHEQISLNAWYIYDTGDLLKQFSDTKKPVSIVKVRLYSSGHQFDVALADVAVFGEK